MLTDLQTITEIAYLEQAYLNDLYKASEFERIEKSLKTASDQLQELINQIN